MKKLIKHLAVYVKPFLKWQFLISYAIPFMVVNGWAWIGTLIAPLVGYNWFTGAASAWLAILWLPGTPEKLITLPAAIWIHTRLFKKDQKTRQQLEEMYKVARADWEKLKNRFKRRSKR